MLAGAYSTSKLVWRAKVELILRAIWERNRMLALLRSSDVHVRVFHLRTVVVVTQRCRGYTKQRLIYGFKESFYTIWILKSASMSFKGFLYWVFVCSLILGDSFANVQNGCKMLVVTKHKASFMNESINQFYTDGRSFRWQILVPSLQRSCHWQQLIVTSAHRIYLEQLP